MIKRCLLLILAMMLPIEAYAEWDAAKDSGSYKYEERKNIYAGDRLTFGIYTGVMNGEAHELVYFGSHKLSELIWDIRNAYMLGASVNAVIAPSWGLKLNGSISSTITKSDSTMDDFDWLIIGADWTHWSHHDNTKLERGLAIDLNVSKEVYASKDGSFAMDVALGFKRDNWRWSAAGGTFIYSTFTFRDTVGVFANIPVISYEQTINTPYIGVSMNWHEGDFSLFTRVIGSIFVSADAVDHHYLRNLVFTDQFKSGKMIGIDLNWAYHLNEEMRCELIYSYQNYVTNRGDTSIYNQITGVVTVNPDTAGMSLSYHTIGLKFTYAF